MTEIHSDWGDWLPRAVERADPDGVAVWYLGCNGFVLKGAGGTTLFVDPYLGTGSPPRTVRMIPVPFAPEDVASADAVFATHEHSDHVDAPSQAPILASTGATFYGPSASVAAAREQGFADYGVADDQLETVGSGTSVDVGEFTVHVEIAHDPDADDPVSYVFEHEAGTVFHGGDTKPTDDFERVGREYDIDLGVLAFGTYGRLPDERTGELAVKRWYCDENQVVEAADALRIERLLPSHWDMWKRLTADPASLHHHVRGFDYPERLEVVEIGDRVDV